MFAATNHPKSQEIHLPVLIPEYNTHIIFAVDSRLRHPARPVIPVTARHFPPYPIRSCGLNRSDKVYCAMPTPPKDPSIETVLSFNSIACLSGDGLLPLLSEALNKSGSVSGPPAADQETSDNVIVVDFGSKASENEDIPALKT